ncbi:hypothetical protein AQUCO_01700502v1 [Aquilegia coerulea]|uniref:Bifunctional inhibitor/plant lipid transfer protein/seed storage helical domain-containing protein n=1 Tax=Aquilegia coerulea TaxID=218851 RepID=A0A2G5DNC7_AQUCA|nr:hypothetical protein AQUCO_01700502v1 [Aquilegia coerulea]
MALKGMKISLLMVLVIMLWAGGAYAQSSCTNVIISMSPCLNYITGNSSTPSSSCCSQLRNVVRSQPQCLCQVLDGGASLGLDINQTQALALPSACNVETPPVSRCNAASPAESPAGTADSPTTLTEPGNKGGSKTVPSQGGVESSDGISIKLPFSLLCVLLLIASHETAFSNY